MQKTQQSMKRTRSLGNFSSATFFALILFVIGTIFSVALGSHFGFLNGEDRWMPQNSDTIHQELLHYANSIANRISDLENRTLYHTETVNLSNATAPTISSTATLIEKDSDENNLPPNAIGIWYSTFYAAQGHYIWTKGHGINSQRQFCHDVNGDGRADAAVFFESTGKWYVAISNGDGFANYSEWIANHGTWSSNQFLKDVNGDGMADSVVFFEPDGRWQVALSSGDGFLHKHEWTIGHGVGSTNQFLDDVDGNGCADAVVYFGDKGRWYVALSDGERFGGYSEWITEHGEKTTERLLADVTGDKKADAVVYLDTGMWRVAESTGENFKAPRQWIDGHGINSTNRLLGDVTGDGKADAVLFFRDGKLAGEWYVAESNGSAFAAPGNPRAYSHGNETNRTNGVIANTVFLADTTGRGIADPLIFAAKDGTWRTMRWQYMKPNRQNTWEAWNILAIPKIGEEYRQYDSGETDVIDAHLEQIHDAGIDFILLDQTNKLHTDGNYIWERAIAVGNQIGRRRANQEPTPLMAIAVGAIQFEHDITTVEAEAKDVWNEFIIGSGCGGRENYVCIDGRPLLVVYAELPDRKRWENWKGDKTMSDKFSIRFAQGVLGSSSRTCGTNGEVPQSDFGLYFGWGTLSGSLENKHTMVAMPGWNNHLGCLTRRQSGQFYINDCWKRIHNLSPDLVVINSFNEYAEETAVAPTSTAKLLDPSEKWTNANGLVDDFMYWRITKEECLKRKSKR